MTHYADKEPPTPIREGRELAAMICSSASKAIAPNAEREATHGPMEASFGKCAELWSAYLGYDISPSDVAALLAMLKFSRIKTGNSGHLDHYIDIAGYAGLMGALNGAR